MRTAQAVKVMLVVLLGELEHNARRVHLFMNRAPPTTNEICSLIVHSRGNNSTTLIINESLPLVAVRVKQEPRVWRGSGRVT